MIKDVSAKLIERNITLSYNIDILNYLVQLAGSRQYGARDLRQTIRREIEDKITDLILENNGDVSEIIVDIKDNALTFTTK